ncbi:MAG: hypothetical protein IT164_03425 [Bryobacterales bacterium]|nr:hypothetical protein [Bryobacterales bacterium]
MIMVKLLSRKSGAGQPIMRPLQTTTDLAGFWSRLDPELRRQLSRRYPKHSRPQDPLTASPPLRR